MTIGRTGRLPGRDECLMILKKSGASAGVIAHSETVCRAAEGLSDEIRKAGAGNPDIRLVTAGAILHDIGRSRTHGVTHGFVGGQIVQELGLDERLVRITERHVGAGIPMQEAKSMGLPERDFIPETLEEKIVCYADKLAFGHEIKSSDETIKDFEEELGRDHPAVKRLREFCKSMQELIMEERKE